MLRRSLPALALAAAVAVPAVATAQRPDPPGGEPPAPTGPAPVVPDLSPRELEVLRDVERMFERYAGQAEVHHQRMRKLLKREFDKRLKELEQRYAERIERTQEAKRRRHLEAIALLEKFIEDHPNHKKFTPDAMFRLADLYLDEAEYELEQLEEGDDPEAIPIADYSKSIALWEEIIERFPDYRQLPGTIYLLAHYNKMNDERRSLQLFLSLVCANHYQPDGEPKAEPTREQAIQLANLPTLRDPYSDCQPLEGAEPALVQHAWVRGVGDHQFNVPGEMDEAISAYGKVVSDKDAELYAEALYKLAWSYYRRDKLIDAIKRFDESVILYDATVAAGEQPKLDLREEALQYIAVSFTDPWHGELETDPALALQRAKEFYEGREDEPHVRDVWEVLGNAFTELQAWDQAVDAYRIAISDPWHLHPNNPVLHQSIVDAYVNKGDKFAADEAAAELATRYAPGTPWYEANEANREAMENQRAIGERMLMAAAQNTHKAASDARKEWEAAGTDDPEEKQAWIELYNKAIGLYESFLAQYPESEKVYDFTYAMADAYFYSERYLEAVPHYVWVRDHRELSEKYFQDAASSIVDAYRLEVEREVAAGNLQPLEVPTPEELKALPQPVEPQPIPELYLQLRAAWDDYQRMVSDPKTAPDMGLNAALVSVAYYHFDDAINRFGAVFDKFCGTPQAEQAKDGLLAIYDARGQEDLFRKTNEQFIAQACGDAEAIEMAKSQNRAIEFRRANEALSEGEYELAGEQFYKYYKTAPDNDTDRPTALYNAGIAYMKADRPKTAIGLFKDFTESNNELFKSSPYLLEAVRLTALSHQASYDYDKAVSTYLRLYQLAKTAKGRGITPPPTPEGEPQDLDTIKLQALYNAAVLLELDRDFDQAVRRYRQYEREETDRRQSDRAAWAVARIYRMRGDVRNLRDAYGAWRRKYGRDEGNEDDFVHSHYDLAEAYGKKGMTRQADAARRDTIQAWVTVGRPTGGQAAREAAEYDLMFRERYFKNQWQRYAIKEKARSLNRSKQLIAQLDKRRAQAELRYAPDDPAIFQGLCQAAGVGMQKCENDYKPLARYGVPEYTVAALVRQGEIKFDTSSKLFAMPMPRWIENISSQQQEEIAANYQLGLENQTKRFVEQAKELWVVVVDTAKKNNVQNRWVQRALEKLSTEFPAEYEALHQEIIDQTTAP